MYNPSLLADLAVKNGAKIKRSTKEINDAILASPQAKIVPFNTPANFFKRDTSFEVSEGSDTITVSFAATVSAPVSTHVGDETLTEVEYGRSFTCEAVLDVETMRIKEGSLRLVDFHSSSDDATSNKERLTKESEQQARERVFDREEVVENLSGLPYGESYLHGVRLSLVENPEPWVQALVDDLRTQCCAVFDSEETYCDPASPEAGHGSFPNDLYPIHDRVRNILRAGIRGEGDWAAYAPLIRAATPENVRSLYRLPEDLPLLKVEDLPVSAEDTKTLGALLSVMELIGVSTPEQEKLVEQHKVLTQLHDAAPRTDQFYTALFEKEGWVAVERINLYNSSVNAIATEGISQPVADAVKALRWHLKTSGVLRTLYEAQEKRSKVKPLQDLNCLPLGAYLRVKGSWWEACEREQGKPVSELNTFLPHEYVFAVEEGRSEQVRSDCADFLAHFIPFPVLGTTQLLRGLLPSRISAVDALIISALTRSKKPYSKDEHRSLLEACVSAGIYDTSYVESCGEEELSAIAPHLNLLDPLLSKQKELHEALDAAVRPAAQQAPTFGEIRTLMQAIADTLPLLDSVHCMNKQWVSVQNHLRRNGVPMDKECQAERQQRSEVVDMLLHKLHLTEADLEHVKTSRQLLLGESEEYVNGSTFGSFIDRTLDCFFAVPGYSWPDYFNNDYDREHVRTNQKLRHDAHVPTSQVEVDWGGLQARIVKNVFWAFMEKSPQRDAVFTKDESKRILDYVRTGNVRDIVHESYTWGQSPSCDDAFKVFDRTNGTRMDPDGHIIITPYEVEDAPERREGGRVANERARLANELYSRADVQGYQVNIRSSYVVAVGGTGRGDTCTYEGQEVPHFHGTADELFSLRDWWYTHNGFDFKDYAELIKADPRTWTTYWILHSPFQYEFIHRHSTERRRHL